MDEGVMTVVIVMMMVMKATVPTDVSLERSPRRRSISGVGATEKSVAVETQTSSPFKVTVSVCVCACVPVILQNLWRVSPCGRSWH